MNFPERTALILTIAGLISTIILIAGCTSTPSCSDNPRNMQCMTAEQLEKELRL